MWLLLFIGSALNNVFSWSMNISSSSADEPEALSAFYIAQSIDIDRYSKAAVHEVVRNYNPEDATRVLELLNDHSRLHSRIKVRNGFYDQAYIPLFEGVPYLRRFKVDGNIYITSYVDICLPFLSRVITNLKQFSLLLLGTVCRGYRI